MASRGGLKQEQRISPIGPTDGLRNQFVDADRGRQRGPLPREPRFEILPSVPSPGGREGEQAGQLSRRQFARATVKAGMAAGAAVWVAPQLSTVALAQDTAGSPPPPSTSGTPPPESAIPDEGATDDPSRAAGSAQTGTPGAGELPLTGADVRALAATGGAAVLTGSALVAAQRLSDRIRPRPATPSEGSSGETAR
jgi:hypothetical protein